MNTRFVTTLLCLSLLAGCASPASVAGMTVTPDKVAPGELASAVDVGDVAGGKPTSALGPTRIGNEDFKRALEASLRGAGLLGDAHARYVVSANILKVDWPFFSWNTRVTSHIRYTVTERASGKVVLEQEIEADCVVRMTDSMVGAERVRLANQGSARKSIASLIEKLESARLAPPRAVASR